MSGNTQTPPVTKTETEKDEEKKPKGLKLVVTAHLSEGGIHYKPGDEIEVSPERAKALGGLVKKPVV